MVNALVKFALGHRGWVLGTSVLITIVGLLIAPELPIDAVPDITNIQVVINTQTGALDPEKIETMVTRPIEMEMVGLGELEEVRSISKYGLSQVTLVFGESTNIYWARQQVGERLINARKELPVNISPGLAPITTGLGEVLMYSVDAEPGSELSKLSEVDRLTELRTIQDFVVKPALKKVQGIADIDSNGGYKKQIHINFFPEKLDAVGLSIEQLTSRLETLGENFGGGYIQRSGDQIIVRTVPGFQSWSELSEMPLGLNVQGRPIKLGAVAEVRSDHVLRLGSATSNGHEIVLGTALMRVGANSRTVAQDLEEALSLVHVPKGIKITQLYSRTYLVNATLGTISKSLIEGAVLVIIVLLLLLGNMRAAVLVSLAIPLSMLVAITGMEGLGISGNLMSLGAIDFGLLVDGSVVLIENVLRRMQLAGKMSLTEKRSLIESASLEVIQPIVMGLGLIMVVYVPILSLEGVEGKMFRPMAVTVLLALFASLWIAVMLMPVLADLWIRQAPVMNTEHHETPLLRWIQRLYTPLLRQTLGHPKTAMSIAIGVVILGGGLLLGLGADFIPQLDEGDLVICLSRNPRIGVTASTDAQLAVERTILKHPEVETVFSRLGTPESATDPMGVNLADTFIILKKDRSKWIHPSKQALFEEIEKELIALNPDQEISATQPIEMRFNEILEGSRADVTLRIFGQDLGVLLRQIDLAKKTIEKIDGVSTVSFDPLTALKSGPMLDIIPKFDSLARFGITLGDLNRVVELSMSGKEVGTYLEQGRRIPVVVHLDESLRDHLEQIDKIPVGLPQGGTLSLDKIAKIELGEKVTTIARSWGERYAAISINLKDRDVASFVNEARTKVELAMRDSPGARLYWGGQFKNLDRARTRLFIIVPATLLVIFLLLWKMFGSLSLTGLIFSSIPFAAVGGVFALAIRGMHFSVSAAVGFIALIGIALLNSLVLMEVLRSERDVMKAALSRLRPVMMTAMVASLGFLPMALSHGLGAEVQKPLATVVIGGLITSTLLTLLLLPTLYQFYFGSKTQPR